MEFNPKLDLHTATSLHIVLISKILWNYTVLNESKAGALEDCLDVHVVLRSDGI